MIFKIKKILNNKLHDFFDFFLSKKNFEKSYLFTENHQV